jgi:hypothetical protein
VAGSHSVARAIVSSASGTFTAKMARQPSVAASSPPSTGPTAALDSPASDSSPSTGLGAGRPTRSAWARSSAIADGYAAEVPTPSSTRDATSHPSDGANAPTTPAVNTAASPARNTRRGPSRSASLPMVGWPIALARYSDATSQAVSAAPACRSCPIAASAVAIIVELTGFSTEPSSSGVIRRAPNPSPGIARAVPAGSGREGPWRRAGDRITTGRAVSSGRSR